MSTALKIRPQAAVDLSFIIQADEGQFYVHCPQLPGLHIDGPNEQEALARAVDAAELYLCSLKECGEGIPSQAREEIPAGSILRTVALEWPSRRTSGIS